MHQLQGNTHESQDIENLSLRKRIFSFTHKEFPSLDDIDHDKKTTGSTNGKHNSGVKTYGSLSISFEDATEERIFEDPRITEEKVQDLDKYMNSKEQKFSIPNQNSFLAALSPEDVILQNPFAQTHW